MTYQDTRILDIRHQVPFLGTFLKIFICNPVVTYLVFPPNVHIQNVIVNWVLGIIWHEELILAAE